MIVIGRFDRKLTDGNNAVISFAVPNYYSMIDLDKSKDYKIEITEVKSKRSLWQNKMMWALIHEIARSQGMSDDDVYCQIIEMTGVRTESFVVERSALEILKRAFKIVKVLDEMDDRIAIHCYFGTSTFDTKEMSEFIDRLLDYANQVGIDTREWK